MADPHDVQQVLDLLMAAFPQFGKEIEPEQLAKTFALYEMLLADIPADILRAAAVQHANSSQWFPKISELRALALAATEPAELGRTAVEAWGDVRDAFTNGGTGGYYEYADRIQFPDFSHDPILQAVVNDMGGMHHLSLSDNEVADRARFIEAYEARQRRAKEDRKLLPQVRELRDRLQAGKDTSGLFGQVADKLRLKS